MFLGLFVSGLEFALITIEAANVIAMRMPMIAKGNAQGQIEAELMVAEKFEAFAQAGADMMADVPGSITVPAASPASRRCNDLPAPKNARQCVSTTEVSESDRPRAIPRT
jgi:hypothetical protein